KHRLDRRARAMDHDVGLRRLQRFHRVAGHLDAETLRQPDDFSGIPADLRWIGVSAADNLEARTSCDLLQDRTADRPEPVVKCLDGRHERGIIARAAVPHLPDNGVVMRSRRLAGAFLGAALTVQVMSLHAAANSGGVMTPPRSPRNANYTID